VVVLTVFPNVVDTCFASLDFGGWGLYAWGWWICLTVTETSIWEWNVRFNTPWSLFLLASLGTPKQFPNNDL